MVAIQWSLISVRYSVLLSSYTSASHADTRKRLGSFYTNCTFQPNDNIHKYQVTGTWYHVLQYTAAILYIFI